VTGDKALKAWGLGIQTAYVAAGIIGAVVLWKLFGKKATTTRALPPPVGGSSPEDPAAPSNRSDPEGIVSGNLQVAVTAQIISPPKDGEVSRRWLGSTFPVEIELASSSMHANLIDLEVVCDFYEFAGAERLGIRSALGNFDVAPGQVRRVSAQIDSGNFNQLSFEFGQALCIARVLVNGDLAQETSFNVS
jgi:hypothetical protein